MSEFTRIPIATYTAPFTEYPVAFRAFAEANGLQCPSLDSQQGQALALMSQPENAGLRYCVREDCEAFLARCGFASGDAIQPFNKVDQKGFGKAAALKRGQYALPFPFVADMTHIHKRVGAKIVGDRDAQINAIKQIYQKEIIDVPNADWQLGHLDPTVGDASEANLAYQPPIQARYRDRFKFDKEFRKMWPAGRELIAHCDDYYTEAEQRAIYEALKKRFG